MKSNKSQSRQTIVKRLPQTIPVYALEIDIPELIQYFKELQEKYQDEGTLRLDFDEDGCEIMARRLETDEEMEKRINKEKKIKEKSRLAKIKRDEQKKQAEIKKLKSLIDKHGIPKKYKEKSHE